MQKQTRPLKDELSKKAKRGFRGYPIATIAFYGPTAKLASKVVLSIFRDEHNIADPFERLFSEGVDVRANPEVGEKILELIQQHAVKSVVVTDGIIGCPHEEGIDYPEGKSCPRCPYWAGRDRFSLDRIH